jgi:hypothetical protein
MIGSAAHLGATESHNTWATTRGLISGALRYLEDPEHIESQEPLRQPSTGARAEVSSSVAAFEQL